MQHIQYVVHKFYHWLDAKGQDGISWKIWPQNFAKFLPTQLFTMTLLLMQKAQKLSSINEISIITVKITHNLTKQTSAAAAGSILSKKTYSCYT